MKKIVAIALSAVCFGTMAVCAQNAQLTEAQWKAVEGVYNFSRDNNQYIQFTHVEGGMLQLKALGSGKTILLVPQSELVFGKAPSEGEGPKEIVFHRDSVSGEVDQFYVGDNVVWNRVKNYHPIERKEMAHTPGDLKPFEGIYRWQGDPNRYQYIQFTVKENQLVLKQHWDGREVAFLPDSALHFFTHEANQFTLKFNKSPEGQITDVLAFGRDRWVKQAVAPGAAGLRAYEGKYQSKDDPDNVLQLSVRGGNLVVKQVWDGKETVLTPMTDTYFYNDAQGYPLQVIRGADGKVSSILVLSMQEFDKIPE
jgi:hypothetical protein